MMDMGNIAYVPQLKWKAGERAAISNFGKSWRSNILPLFRLIPPGDYEADQKIRLSEGRFLKKFGAQLFEVCGRLPVLLDGELVDDCLVKEAGQEPFSVLLERSRLAGANPLPVFRQSSSAGYKGAISRHLAWTERFAACLRISPSELEHVGSSAELKSLLEDIGGSCRSSVLLVDAGPIVIDDEEEYAHLLSFHFSRLIREEDWGLVVFASTTFPEKPKMVPWTSKSFDRSDWTLYRHIITCADEFSVLPVFSDYALEYPGDFNPVPPGISPTAHLRYSTENKYFIFQGKSVRDGEKFRKIFRVADQLVGSGIFKGKDYSSGDAYISNLSVKRQNTGTASTWRWCATDHHLNLTLRQLNTLRELNLSSMTPLVEPDQLQLVLP
jgi:hypothetical protein